MHKFPEVPPPTGQTVDVTLTNGSVFPATWDGLQWWIGVPDNADDVPIVNGFVTGWSYQQ